MNFYLEKANCRIEDLAKDLSDGLVLATLLLVLTGSPPSNFHSSHFPIPLMTSFFFTTSSFHITIFCLSYFWFPLDVLCWYFLEHFVPTLFLGEPVPGISKKPPTLRLLKINNVAACLDFMRKRGIKLVGVLAEGTEFPHLFLLANFAFPAPLPSPFRSPFLFSSCFRFRLIPFVDIVDGKIKFLLGMTWSLARSYQIGLAPSAPVEESSTTSPSSSQLSLIPFPPIQNLLSQHDMIEIFKGTIGASNFFIVCVYLMGIQTAPLPYPSALELHHPSTNLSPAAASSSSGSDDDKVKKVMLQFVTEITEESVTDLNRQWKDG